MVVLSRAAAISIKYFETVIGSHQVTTHNSRTSAEAAPVQPYYSKSLTITRGSLTRGSLHSSTISEYSIISDFQTGALIDLQGQLAWLCWPDFDSEACFASLIGTNANGRWTLAPASFRSSSRRYLPNTLVLETTYVNRSKAVVTVTDFMPLDSESSTVVRIVRGIRGSVRMQTCFAPRFDYGNVQARFEQEQATKWNAVAGPHRLTLQS